MNTPAHLLLGAALFGDKSDRRVMGAAFAGAIAPDVSLYLMAGWALNVQNIAPQVVFGELYYSDAWQSVFAIDNSIPVWMSLLALAVYFNARAGVAFAAAGLCHLALDLAVHAGDGRPHFWPFSDWVFHSPVSYWDSQHSAWLIAPVALGLCALAFYRLWPGTGWVLRSFCTVLFAAELWVARQWLLFF